MLWHCIILIITYNIYVTLCFMLETLMQMRKGSEKSVLFACKVRLLVPLQFCNS